MNATDVCKMLMWWFWNWNVSEHLLSIVSEAIFQVDNGSVGDCYYYLFFFFVCCCLWFNIQRLAANIIKTNSQQFCWFGNTLEKHSHTRCPQQQNKHNILFSQRSYVCGWVDGFVCDIGYFKEFPFSNRKFMLKFCWWKIERMMPF